MSERVRKTVTALEEGNIKSIRALMAGSHQSLRDNYEVSCQELDVMVELASELPGLVGARMTGGGFGGCTVNLIDESHIRSFCGRLTREYEQETGMVPAIYACDSAPGVREDVLK